MGKSKAIYITLFAGLVSVAANASIIIYDGGLTASVTNNLGAATATYSPPTNYVMHAYNGATIMYDENTSAPFGGADKQLRVATSSAGGLQSVLRYSFAPASMRGFLNGTNSAERFLNDMTSNPILSFDVQWAGDSAWATVQVNINETGAAVGGVLATSNLTANTTLHFSIDLSQNAVWTNYLYGIKTTAPIGGEIDQLRIAFQTPTSDNGTFYIDNIKISSGLAEKNIETSTGLLNITEGSTSNFQVRLNSQPDASVTVNVSRVSGSANIEVVAGSESVVFTTTDWNIWQSIAIQALSDADSNNDTGMIACIDAGSVYSAINVIATQIDTTVLPPVAFFNTTPTSGYAPLSVSFTDTSTGSITNRFWNFGDGATTNTTATNVLHIYTVAGTNTVQLIVSGAAGISTNTQVNLIQAVAVPPDLIIVPANNNDRYVTEYPLSDPASNVWKIANRRVGDAATDNRFTVVIPFQLPTFNGSRTNITGVTLKMFAVTKTSFSGATDVYVDILGGRVDASPLTTDADIIPANVLLANAEQINSNTVANIAKIYTLDANFFKTIYDNDPSAAGKYVFITLRANKIDPNVANSFIDYGSAVNATVAYRPSLEMTVLTGQTVPDSDGDGLPDDWETLYFGGSTNANPSALAANGINTLQEAYVAGLNPTNSASRFNLSMQQIASQKLLQWSAVSGRVCSVYWTTNLLSGFQSLETNIVWPQNSWTDLVHGVQNGGFYQIKIRLTE